MDKKTPKHYAKNGMDVIEFSKLQFCKEEIRGFMRINAIKYLVRYMEKNMIEDLEKAKHYIEMLIDLEGE